MKVKLSSTIEGIEFQIDESQTYLNILSGEVVMVTDDELRMAESKEDVSDQAEWYIEAVKRTTKLLENEVDFQWLNLCYVSL